MSNLKICYPHAQMLASTVTAPTADTGFSTDNYSIGNILNGNRTNIYRIATAGTSTNIDFDLGASLTINPDYFIVARADYIYNTDTSNATLTLSGDTVDTFATKEDEALTLSSANLKGRYGQDTILETTYATAYRYWRFNIATTATFKHSLSKLYFGNWFDFGRDPIYVPTISIEQETEHRKRPNRKITLKWEGITEAKRLDFQAKIGDFADIYPVFLYDTNDLILNGADVSHVRILSHIWETKTYGNALNITFEELY